MGKNMAKKGASLSGELSLKGATDLAVTADQIRLLEAVRDTGSITAAAKSVSISYKTAWDRINQLNNIATSPLVIRTSGGARGGGTQLTEAGEQIIEGFRALQQEHSTFLHRLGESVDTLTDIAKFMHGAQLRTSARNQYLGTITTISRDETSAEVTLNIGTDLHITAQITPTSLKELKLEVGMQALALVKSSWVLLSREANIPISTRNKLPGTVNAIHKGKVNSEVVLDLGTGKSICAIITNQSLKELKLKEGSFACALFKASSVIMMVA